MEGKVMERHTYRGGGRKVAEVLAAANVHNNKLEQETKDGRGCGEKDV